MHLQCPILHVAMFRSLFSFSYPLWKKCTLNPNFRFFPLMRRSASFTSLAILFLLPKLTSRVQRNQREREIIYSLTATTRLTTLAFPGSAQCPLWAFIDDLWSRFIKGELNGMECVCKYIIFMAARQECVSLQSPTAARKAFGFLVDVFLVG